MKSLNGRSIYHNGSVITGCMERESYEKTDMHQYSRNSCPVFAYRMFGSRTDEEAAGAAGGGERRCRRFYAGRRDEGSAGVV